MELMKNLVDWFLQIVELGLLVLIWRDGVAMRDSALRYEKLFEVWLDERKKRSEAASKARDTKAAKADVKESHDLENLQ